MDQRVDLFLKEVDRQVSVSFALQYEDLIPVRCCLLDSMYIQTLARRSRPLKNMLLTINSYHPSMFDFSQKSSPLTT